MIYEGVADLHQSVDLRFTAKLKAEEILSGYCILGPYLLYVGNAYPHKNLESLINVFIRLRKHHPFLKLVLVGRDDYFYHRLKLFAQEAGDNNQSIIFPGYVPDRDLQTLFEHAAVYVFPSKYEGFGLPPLEAMSRGCAVVSSTATCLPEVLGDAASYFDPNNEEAMYQTIESVLVNPTVKNQLTSRGKERIKLYSWLKAGQETLKIYQRVLKKILFQSHMYSYQRTNRFEIAFRRLTVVRIFFWFGRIFKRAFFLLGRVLFRILRFFGLLLIEIGYGIKLKLVDWRYSEKKEKIKIRSLFVFCFSVLWLIPKAILRFLKRISELSIDTAAESRQGVVEETRLEFKPSSPEMVKWSFKWSLVNFVLTLLLIISPIIVFAHWRKLDGIKQTVLSSGVTAFEKLFSAKSFLETQNVPQAQTAFSEASTNFLKAQQDLSAVHNFLFEVAAYVPNKSARLASVGPHLLSAGQLSAQLGAVLSQALVLPTGQEATVSNFLRNFLLHAEPSLPLARKLEKEMSKIDSTALPDTYKQQFIEFSSKVHFLSQSLDESIDLAKEASIFLGEKVDKRYMLVFQNNTEKRGPGGFIGSFALVDIRRGQITRLTVPKGGTYDTEAGLTRLVAAPEPLRLLNPRWHFWDANWWPDWPTSAKKLMWFYENSNGPSVDGVISLTPTVIERALEVIGPIDMTADYGVVIDSQNFWTTTQTFSEQKPDVTKEPKKLLVI